MALPVDMTLRALALSLVVGACLVGGSPSARAFSAIELLSRYASGDFAAVVEALHQDGVDYNEILKQLRREGPGWIDAAGPLAREKRELTAATFALEAARAGEWQEWKLIQRQPNPCGDCQPPLSVLYWKAPPLLIEWGCALLRRRETPLPAERLWQLAALAVAQRSEDAQFLVGDPNIGRGAAAGEIGNLKDEIKHLDHVMERFPREVRFLLAQGVARDRVWPLDAVQAYRALEHDPDVGGEAMMRLGAMQLRAGAFVVTAYTPPGSRGSVAEAIAHFARAETLTRDPYVIFLSRYFAARAFEREGRPDHAEGAYRAAARAVPHAQSATIALAALAFRGGRRSEAQGLVRDMFAADPAPLDPWRAYAHADDRFWPELVARLRAEILR